MTLAILDEATEELLAAIRYLESDREGKGDRLLEIWNRKLSEVTENPMRFPPAEDGPRNREVRYVLLDPFSYRVVFELVADTVTVLALAHLRRKPGYWRRRLKDSI